LGIGTELTRGDIANSNGAWLAKELTLLGFEVTAIDVVDDEPNRIVSALRRLAETHELVICTGGLGPTTDDVTTVSAARALGVDLALDPGSVEAIVLRLAQFGRSMTESNRKQALFPIGAEILPNHWGTAPGFSIQLGRARCVFLPGVPSEMMAIFQHQLIPSLALPFERTPHEVLLRTFGLPESTLNDRLRGIEQEFQVIIGYRVRMPEIDVKLHARNVRPDVAMERAERAAAAVIERLGEVVYGRGEVTLAGVLAEKLVKRGLYLGVGESCTGGLVASLLTAEAGASCWFRGGVVAYSNQVKSSALRVPSAIIEANGAVSIEVAEGMAEGVAAALGCNVGIGVTGIAGPGGGTEQKPVGTVCFAVHGPFGTRSEAKLFAGERTRIQRWAAYYALAMLNSALRPSSSAPES
ncbi:MAG TPA: CinA family nicotinamide mononucleotide deamidase-related protein, partial [Polyangiaceae bacterium]|nr:CinA family nicotinamide mononucleotide deamidase-related protein [Polyangiaceae bacterium]